MRHLPPRAFVPFAALFLVFAAAACGGGDNNVLTLEEGQCFQDPEDGDQSISNVDIVDCDEPHDNEVFHVEELDDGDFPGASEIDELGEEVCTEEVFDFLGGDPSSANVAFATLDPTEESWEEADDRSIVCFAYAGDLEELDGSLEDAADGLDATDDTEPTEDTTTTEPTDDTSGGGSDEAGDAEEPPDVDDPELVDAVERCYEGSGSACDEVFFGAATGSDLEEWANTCGGRFDTSPGFCATVIGD